MKAIEFVKAVRDSVVENDNREYQNLLDSNTAATDPVWKGFMPVYKSMSPEQQASFLQFLRMIQVNTLSHIFGILDGSTFLSDQNEDFVLSTSGSEEVINGDLQDIFLEIEETSG